KPGTPNVYGLVGGEANAVQPAKRPLSSMSPTIVAKGGKTCLVTGDHPQGYSNDLTLFGRRRGSGETIWDIKQHIGYVSS
ncbi:gamma-glutamyltransferase, partial [Pantoea agglomerans]|uniref:gamma-glutamyltransferase n=1 Tax=Enterobacter agglomerans TaxID=549 RepID=UPI001F5D5424